MSIRVALAVVATLALMATATVAPASAAITPTIRSAPGTQLFLGVACATPTTCFAAGFSGDNGQTNVIVPITDGIPGTPQVPVGGGGGGLLVAVACSSPTTCFAVGNNVIVPITNGVAGTPQGVPGMSINAITCPTATFCVAVGADQVVTINGITGVPGVVQTVPGVISLNGVACNTAASCVAVGNAPGGDFFDAGVVVPIIDGIAGTPQSVFGSAGFKAVSCPDATTCWAVGDGDFFADESFFGSVVVPIVNGVPGAAKSIGVIFPALGIDCVDATHCVAVGFGDVGQMVEIVNGIAGPVQNYPETRGFYAVDCPSASTCFAVGGLGVFPDYLGAVATIAVTATETSISCTPGTSAGGVSQYVCKVTDPDGLRSIVVRDATTGQLQTSLSLNCAKATKSSRFRVPAGVAYKVIVTDCNRPGSRTTFLIGATGGVNQA